MLELRQTEENNGLILSISFKLDKEDAADLIKDLQAYIDTPNLYNKAKVKFHNKEHEEAFEQAQRKLALEKEMKRVFVDVFDDEYLETKFATTYKLDAINREVEILRKKLNKQ
jgi:hypothetical protein